MKRRSAFVCCIIGVLVFASLVKAQETRGTPGVDYPNYFEIPETSFKCSEQKYNPGFYADLETKCQAFHFCYQDRQESFLCPTGTIFNQAVLTCDVWHKSNCSLAPIFFSVNVGPVMERAGKNLPMLLRLRNRSHKKPSIQTTTANVFDKVSSLYETDNQTPAETSIYKDGSSESMVEMSEKSTDGSSKDFDSKDGEQMQYHSVEDFESEKSTNEETYAAEFSNENTSKEEMDTNLVYDPIADGYYQNFDQYEAGWQDSEPIKDFNVYEKKNPANEYGSEERQSQQKHYVNEDESFEDSEYPEFTKRSSHTGHSRKTVRRKPVYVVLDDEHGSESETRKSNEKSNHESSDALAESESNEFNLTSREYADEATSNPEPFPRPTRIPSHLLELSTETPMTSEEFGAAIFRELVVPQLPDDYGTLLASTYPQDQDNFQSDQKGEELDDQSDDETIYIENDMERESYVPYVSQYVPESSDKTYEESSHQMEADSSDTEDTFVVIPDEYDDNVVDSVSTEDDLEMSDNPEEYAYRREMFTDGSPVAEYGTYGNSYQYSPIMGYPEQYQQTFTPAVEPMINQRVVTQQWPGELYQGVYYPEMATGMYRNPMTSDPRYGYEDGYEIRSELPVDYESSDTENANSGLYPFAKAEMGVTESPLDFPVTEADFDNFSTEDLTEVADSEQDMIEGPEQEANQSEDVYYVLDFDEQSSEANETNESEIDENVEFKEDSSSEDREKVDENHKAQPINLSNDTSSHTSNVPLDTDGGSSESKTDNGWSSNSLTITQDVQSPPEVKSAPLATNPMNTISGSSFEQGGQPTSPARESSPSQKTQSYSSNIGGFDFSTDSRFMNNMGYQESMDFGPYGFGPNMGQQFSMMESTQQRTAGNPFLQRMGQNEQSQLSPLSAIQEKMRSMKQGKFGAFKKYMSSNRK